MDERLKFEERWMSLPEAAHKLGRSWAQTYRLALSGMLEARQKANGRWLISRASLDEARGSGIAGEQLAGVEGNDTAEEPAA